MPGKTSNYVVIFAVSISCISSAHAISGQQLANQGNGKGALACVSCHGADGAGNAAASFPRLAGLNADYLRTQIKRFQSGERVSPVMTPIAKALTSTETEAVTTYFAGLQTPSKTHATAPTSQVGEQLATLGSWADRQLPACEQCHAPGGSGIGSVFPALTGQPASYIRQQLIAWQQGTRRGDPNNLMQSVAKRLTQPEINSVADYFASLPWQSSTANTTSPHAAVPAAKPHKTLVEDQGEVRMGRDATTQKYFSPPAHSAYPDGPFGEAVRSGEAIFTGTNSNPLSGRYVGNDQQCANCHLDGGRLANAAPMWAAWVAYPTYRKKNHKVNTIVMRVQGCFTY
jgi:thiosulfate dehydrogenase